MKGPVVAISHPLESIADIRYGFTAKASFDPVGPKFLRITDIQDGIVDWDSVPYCEAPKKDFEKFKLSPGEIVFARTGATTGKSYLIKDKVDAVFASYLIRVKPVSGRIFSPYLAYYFQTADYWADISAGTEGAAQGGFNASKLGQLKVPLPSLDEQKRIVAVLDQAFAALDRVRALVEANLVDAHSLFESELQASFERLADGRDQVPFERLCDAITPRVKIKRQDYLEVGAYPIVSQEASLVSGYWNDSAALLGLNDPVVVFGDHTCCLKYVDFDFVVGADGTKVLKPKPGVSAAYLYFGLRNHPIAEGGYARHFKLLRERSLPDVPLDRQRVLADRLFDLEEKCGDMARMYEAKLADLANLRQSLLQKAFSGELT